jgi:acetyl-CoA/propionyl-CoA carboxylase biotin carboxyl carrier protein
VVTLFVPPAGPGVRVDAGIETGSVIGGNFDSLLAKVIVYGASRAECIERSRRVLDEIVVDGMATALTFHRAIVRDPAFTSEPFTVHTRWIETEFDNRIPPFAGGAVAETADARETLVVEVGGKRIEVTVPVGVGASVGRTQNAPKRTGSGRKQSAAASGDSLTSPMQGTIVKLGVAEGDEVAAGDLIVVLEAMKMEQPLNAHKAGIVTSLAVSIGDVVTAGSTICDIKTA